jgi:hypothetical protein
VTPSAFHTFLTILALGAVPLLLIIGLGFLMLLILIGFGLIAGPPVPEPVPAAHRSDTSSSPDSIKENPHERDRPSDQPPAAA